MKHRLEGTRDDYIIHRDDQPGRVEFSRVDEKPPQHIVISLELIQSAHPSVMRVGNEFITLLNDEYRVVGWNGYGLECELWRP